jgi:hypothetical protein
MQPSKEGHSPAEICEMLTRDHNKMRSEVLTRLGFLPGVERVCITPKFQNIQYLFNTQIMKPSASAAIIRSWK